MNLNDRFVKLMCASALNFQYLEKYFYRMHLHIQYFSEVSENVYIKASPPITERELINELLNDNTLIPDDYIYRPTDENFGKAKNIKNRLNSYFGSNLPTKTRRMVHTAVRVDWTLVKTEVEALQLEFTWIKQFEPPFNVQFRDDKSYPYLAISMGDEFPRAFITRRRGGKGVVYFGPYTKTWAIRETLDTLLKVYPVRSCSAGVFQRARSTKRACLLADIGKCAAGLQDARTDAAHRRKACAWRWTPSSGCCWCWV